MKKLLFMIAIAPLLTQLGGCKGDENGTTPGNATDRQAVLVNWADNIVKPAYSGFEQEMDLLAEKAAEFTASPGAASLNELRNAWADAYVSWQTVELFEFGPANTVSLRNFFNIYPVNVTQIQTLIDNPEQSLEVPAAYPAQGFPSIDYLINGIAADDDGIIAAFSTDEKAAANAAFLIRLTDRMQTLTNDVITQWNGSYRDAFVSSTGLDIGSSMGNVVNAYVLEYERYVRSGKVGIPAGVFSSGTVQPDKVEAFYKKDLSRQLALTAHRAAHDFFNGKHAASASEGPSFRSYLDAIGAKDATSGQLLSVVINDQFEEVEGKLSALSDNFSHEVQTNNDAMTDAYASMQKLVRLLKLDMTSALSITITYTDNDGD